MKSIENLPFSYGLGKEFKREVKGAKSAIKARIREVQRQSTADALRLSVLSLNEALDAYALRRVCAVTLYSDFGEESEKYGGQLAKEARRLMEEEGFERVFASEPETGTHLITLFGSSPEEDGPTFRERVERFRAKLAESLKAFSWPKIKKGAAKGASVVVMAAGFAGAANAMHVDLKKMQVPPAAVEYVIASGSAVSILRECKKMMEKKEEPGKKEEPAK
jgi:hypothetical protein